MAKPGQTPHYTHILKQWLSPPVFPDDEDKTRVAYRLNAVAWVGIIVSLLYAIVWLVVLPQRTSRLIFFVPVLAVFAGVIGLIRSGRVQVANTLMLGGSWLIVTLVAASAGGTRAPFFGFYVLVVMSAVIFSGWRATAYLATLTFFTGLVMVHLANKGVIEEPFATPMSAWLTQASIMIFVALNAYILVRDMQRSLQRAQQALAEREKSDVALRESETRYRALFENAPIGIGVSVPGSHVMQLSDSSRPTFVFEHATDFRGSQVLMVNGAFERLYGYSEEEIRQMDPYEPYLHAEDRDHMLRQLKQAGQIKDYEVQRRRKDGTVYYSSVTIAPFPVAGEGALLLMEIDVTERKRLEEEARETEILRVELEKERELVTLRDRFISIVSHEFRTPLAVIRTASDMLSRYFDRLDETAREQKLQQIQGQVTHLAELIDGVLAISRTQSGRTELNPAPLDLDPFCRNIFEQVQFTDTEEHTFEYVSKAPDDPVMADANLLQHVLTNLLTNAVKYSPAGSRVTFELDHDDIHVTMKISDQGIGIPEEDQARLFEPFHRAGNVGNTQGTGLGLSIARDYVALHGGIIDVESAIGTGSTFTIRLPVSG